jgi:hypothetical protein
MNTSIVIPLGIGSHWQNQELRYCLRSIEKHLRGYGDIFIIGEKPPWLRHVIHIPFDEGFAPKCHEKERNIFTKIMAACADERVTDDFLFMNDDHYLLREYEAGAFPYYYDGDLAEKMTVTDYKHTVWNTMALFNEEALYFDIHCPIIYNKLRFQYTFLDVNWSRWGYCIKSVYMNSNSCAIRTEEYPDLKISEAYPASKIRELLAGRGWFSIGDRAREGELLQVLKELYPNKSKYEL